MNYKTWQYPGGEVGVRLTEDPLSTPLSTNKTIPTFRIQSSNDLVACLMALDAFQQNTGKHCQEITIPYLPYARQDRVAIKGDPFAIKVLAKVLASVGVTKVHSHDVHSEKGIAAFLTEGITLTSTAPTSLIEKYIAWIGTSKEKVCLVAPDAGSREKVTQYCGSLGIPRAIQCFKKRDPDTGELKGFLVDEETSATLKGLIRDNIKHLIITDDICDGGGTFLGVAETLQSHYKTEGDNEKFLLHLWTTHGIYSKGVDPLLDKFDTLGCSDSFTTAHSHSRLFKTSY